MRRQSTKSDQRYRPIRRIFQILRGKSTEGMVLARLLGIPLAAFRHRLMRNRRFWDDPSVINRPCAGRR